MNDGKEITLEEAYATYRKILDENPSLKPKGLSDYLKESPSLLRKVSYEEASEQLGL